MSPLQADPARIGEWTAADQAELDILGFSLFTGVRLHAASCPDCANAGTGIYCKKVDPAIDIFLEWLLRRRLLSRAIWLGTEITEYE